MAYENLLHSGEFVTHQGDIIEVSFYERVDLNAVPNSLWIDADGGTLSISIWSRDGDANLNNGDFPDDWGNIRQVGSERILGTTNYKYYYEIDIDPNPGVTRQVELNVFLETGPYAGIAHIYVPLIQEGQN